MPRLTEQEQQEIMRIHQQVALVLTGRSGMRAAELL